MLEWVLRASIDPTAPSDGEQPAILQASMESFSIPTGLKPNSKPLGSGVIGGAVGGYSRSGCALVQSGVPGQCVPGKQGRSGW